MANDTQPVNKRKNDDGSGVVVYLFGCLVLVAFVVAVCFAGITSKIKTARDEVMVQVGNDLSYNEKMLIAYIEAGDIEAVRNELASSHYQINMKRVGRLALTSILNYHGRELERNTDDGRFWNILAKRIISDGVNANDILDDVSAFDGIVFLLDNGADINSKPPYGDPLICRCSNKAETYVLLSRGADVNAKGVGGNRPIHIAARNGSIDTIKLLLGNGADINAKNDRGETPMKVAEIAIQMGAYEYFKKHGGVE